VVYVAAEGPLWSSGGERGLYKTVDGGETWELVLSVDGDAGVTSLEMDPRNPDVLYAATYERRRKIWSHLAGGPGSGIHKSEDGGASWQRLDRGLPEGDMGKIGLAISPADPDVVYATIEADEEERGFYRSRDRGASWEKRNSYISNGTGPHYYQEIYASPSDVDRVYQMDVFLHVTDDGGANFEIVGNGREKHSDNHALVIDPENPDHLLAGTDAGLYETFDHGVSWRHTRTLPISQFYKLDLDSSEPFYNILGGAQDLGTLFGPSRTNSVEGIRNQDWYVPLGADGYSSQFDTEDPNLLYVEWQGGRLNRYDRRSEEALDIQPQPGPGEPPERFNWDAPVRTRPHSASRLYFASQRLWRSDDRGDSWTAVSGDLTRDRNRYELPIDGRVRSVDALYDNGAMSLYGTITTIAESPLDEQLIYTGSDDGLIQVTEDGGASWRRAGALPGVPELAFVNDLLASLHDADAVFAVIDAHKQGVYSPLIFESLDRGRSWQSRAGDLPDGTILWAVDQDHVEGDLLFVGAEFGLFFSPDGGDHWIELADGVPTIAFRDIEIQRRDDDLVGATFGRGFYILDDYSPLRAIAAGALEEDAVLFPVRDAWWYVPLVPMQAAGKPGQGSTDFDSPNPPYGAVFTYYLKETPKTMRDLRRERERELAEAGDDIPFPGWDNLRAEDLEDEPQILLTVRDATGQPVRRLEGKASSGIHRISWDLRRQPPDPVELESPGFRPPWAGERQGPFAGPGSYTVEMDLVHGDSVETLGERQRFEVKPVPGSSRPAPDFAAVAAFQRTTAELLREVRAAGRDIRTTEDQLRHIEATLVETPAASPSLFERLAEIRATLDDLRLRLLGDRIRGNRNEASAPSIDRRVGQVASGHWDTRQAATATQRRNVELAQEQFTVLAAELADVLDRALPALKAELEAAGAPWTP
ncbi:MAG: glycosyl hydrolase, partial [Acidobacteria bacterium]|nr:glycosyl hydrolase [Acidobacteriota bacterium]